MDNNDILSGFSQIFDGVTANDLSTLKDVEVPDVTDFTGNDDDDFSMLRERLSGSDNNESNDSGNNDGDDAKTDGNNTPPASQTSTEESTDMDSHEAEQVSAFFDLMSENIGWADVPDEDKPRSIESLVDYMKSAIEESSKPSYSSDEVAKLDEFVRNGGDMYEYINITSGILDYSNVNMEDENIQKMIVSELLLEKGFTEEQISKKLKKYEDADILLDEAEDALEYLKESSAGKKEALLEQQRLSRQEAIERQQTFIKDVKTEIEAIKDIRGIPVAKSDIPAFMDYLLKVEGDGTTKFQKDYAASYKPLIESAYLTWKGDAFVNQAKKAGETSASEKFKKALSTSRVSGSKHEIDNGSPAPLWSVASKSLLKRPN